MSLEKSHLAEQKAPIWPVILTVFIDMLGVGIIIPVIPVLFFSDQSEFFNSGVAYSTKSLLYGFLLASYPIMQFFGAPYLGALSDRFGRKPMITISLIGTLIGYLLFSWAILQRDIVLLFISRMLPGFTGGNISVIMSAIADVSDPKDKTKNFGLVGMAFGLGFILGPTIGGVLADSSVVSWFTPATPFWFTAIITFINILLVQYKFRETLVEPRMVSLSLLRGFTNIAKSFRSVNLRGVFSVVLLLALGFTFFTQFFAVVLIEKFDYSEKDIGFLYGWVGVWLVITQGVTVRILNKYISSYRLLLISTALLSIAVLCVLIPQHNHWWFYLISPIIATAQGVTSPNMTTVVSDQADASQQGEVLGIQQSMNSVGQALPPLLAGYLNIFSVSLPIVFAGGIIALGWVTYVYLYTRKRITEPKKSTLSQ